jgi:DNA-binding transcriptional MerR regulator
MSDAHIELPAIPAKRYFTIGEVSELCGVKPYVLRYWEQEFTQLRPMKRRGNRRYYQHHEVLLIRRIRELLYDQGFTISGARNRLVEGDSEVSAADDEVMVLDNLETRDNTVAAAVPMAALASHLAIAELSVHPPLPDNPSLAQLREELQSIHELLSI